MRVRITGYRRGGLWEIDLDHLPVTAERRGSRFFGAFMVVFALVWGGFPTVALVSTWPQPLQDPGSMVMFIFPLVGIGLLLWGLQMFVWRKQITIDPYFVSVVDRGVFGSKSWQEQLGNYRGVLAKTRTVRRKNHSTTYFEVVLQHDDGGKSIDLYSATSDAEWWRKWEEAAKRLKLPALRESAEGMIARDVADLDKSVSELIDEGKVEIDRNLLLEQPDGITADMMGQDLVVTRAGPRNTLIGSLIAVLFPLIFVYVGFFLPDVPLFFGLVFGIVGIIFEVVFVIGVIWDHISRERLRITPQDVVVNTVGPKGESKGRTLSLDAVELVNTGSRKGRSGNALVFAGDGGEINFGKGLPEATLQYLKNLVLARIAERR